MKILLSVENRSAEHSGGRYYASLMALALAELGHKVVLAINKQAVFFNDLLKYFDGSNIEIVVDKHLGFSNKLYQYGEFDLFIGFPIKGGDLSAWFGKWTGKPSIQIILECPLWIERVYNQPKAVIDPEIWAAYKRAMLLGGHSLDLTLEGRKHTIDWLGETFDSTRALQVYPPINERAAKAAVKMPQENAIVFIGRLVGYKNANLPLEIAARHPDKPKVYIISGHFMEHVGSSLRETAERLKVQYELKHLIGEQEKFEIIKRSRLVILPSLFEGYGYPPVEAVYCMVPSVVYDLPVMREIHTIKNIENPLVYFAEYDNKEDLYTKCAKALANGNKLTKEQKIAIMRHYKKFATFDAFKNNLITMLDEVRK